MVIKPTLGRVVWYRASEHVVNAAIIAHVNEDGTVNLAVFNMFGEPYKEAHVIVFQGDSGEEGFNIPRYHCGWMPYQQKAAAKDAAIPANTGDGQKDVSPQPRTQDGYK